VSVTGFFVSELSGRSKEQPQNTPKMKIHPKLTLIALSLCALAFSSTYAQPIPDREEEESVRLFPFSVQESANVGRYQAAEASSGTRIRMDLMEATQGISVVTNEFMTDIGTTRILDAVKYVAGVSINNHPTSMDTMNARSFQSFGNSTVDGFTQYNESTLDPIVVEHIEAVKGPNAIIAPQGLPGGVVNNVTKRPLLSLPTGFPPSQSSKLVQATALINIGQLN